MTLAVAAVSSRAVAASSSAAAAGGAARRVVVIGAGFAGLAAALSLQRSGRCEVTVLEASQRAGGRACTQQVGDAAIELGERTTDAATRCQLPSKEPSTPEPPAGMDSWTQIRPTKAKVAGRCVGNGLGGLESL